MAESGYYIAFRCSPELQQEASQFITLMKKGSPKKQDELLCSMLTFLTNETIDAYLMDLIVKSEIRGTQRNVIEKANVFIRKTAETVISKVARKLTPVQQKGIARHIESCVVFEAEDTENNSMLIGCPIDEDFYNQVVKGHSALTEQGLDAAKPVVIRNQKLLMNEVVEYLVERLVANVTLGPILQKIVRFGIDSSVKLLHTTHEKVFTKMTMEEMQRANQHFSEMLLISPTTMKAAYS
ncbi:MAG: hypothetical protein MI867_10695 [Pseudomonadales bacterium]|nr:hypothetical protein [Pseudomonadales bacterium]